MPIRITGMNSGLDTEALVSELVSAYKTKTNKYVKAQAKVSWKQEAWKSMSSKTYSFRTGLDKVRFSSSYKLKTTSISDSTKASITAGNNAVNGTQSLNITSLAKSGYLTGGKLARTDAKATTADTTLATLGYNGTGKVSLNGKEITLQGDMTISDAIGKFKDAGVNASFDATNQRIFVSSTESGKDNDFTLSALDTDGVQALKSLGLYVKSNTSSELYAGYAAYAGQNLASLLEQYSTNAGIVNDANDTASYLTKALDYANAKQTEKDVNSKLTGDTTLAKDLLNNKDQLVTDSGKTFTYHKTDDGEEYYIRADGSDSTKYYLSTKTTTVKETDKDGNEVSKDVTTRYLSTKEAMESWNAAESDAPADAIEVHTTDDYLKDKMNLTDEEISGYRAAQNTIKNMDDAVQAELKAKAEEAQKAADAGEAYEDPSEQGEYQEYRRLASVMSLVDSGMTAEQLQAEQSRIAAEKEAAQTAMDKDSLLENYARRYENAGKDNDTLSQTAIVQELQEHIAFAKKMSTSSDADLGYNTDAVRIDGEDAIIYLNGAKFTSNSNTFNVNGLTINAQATTTTEEMIEKAKNDASAKAAVDSAAVTITTSNDNQGIYDKIKDFLSEYNSLINSMTASYNAESASAYEPLTDEEREAMTDSQIEKWEEKGKAGVLRRDSTLSALISTLSNTMSRSYEINGKNYSLSNFGIKTLGILNAEKNEQNAYHIDGDADDDATSSKTDKLMAAIVEDPDSVMQFFQKLSNDVYDELGKKMSATSMRTYGTFYNDKEMAKEYSDYTKTIAKWEEKVADIEDSYYKKFSAMETALSKLQSQTSQLSGLLGQ